MNLLTDILKDDILPKLNTFIEPLIDKEVFFDAGHYKELVSRIDKKKNLYKAKKVYPLIWLVMDFRQQYGVTAEEYSVPSAQFFIVEKSDGEKSSLDRIEAVFKPVLIPIAEKLVQLLQNSFLVAVKHESTYDLTLHPYAEGLGKNGNLFNDTVDAIQISNLSLEVKQKIIC